MEEDDDISERAIRYASRRDRTIIGRFGFGIHGMVFATEGNFVPDLTALKIFHEAQPYFRELDAYRRLEEFDFLEIHGFRVPRLVASDDALLAVEMSVVKPPFILDFAGAWLDFGPSFSEEIWEDWERKNQEQFGDDWPRAQLILRDLQDMGIFMLDPSPTNLRFR